MENGKLEHFNSFVLCGMGGSHLAADFIKMVNRYIKLEVCSDYSNHSYDPEKLYILSSFSGNTEEVIDWFNKLAPRQINPDKNMIVITGGGRLLELARNSSIPYIKLPDTDIQPRMALGYNLIALSYVVDKDLYRTFSNLKTVVPENIDCDAISELVKSRVPLIYTTERCRAIGYNWKIKLNETGKIPAFNNVIPEANHNEIMGYSRDGYVPIFIKNRNDHPRNRLRMETMGRLLTDKGYNVVNIDVDDSIVSFLGLIIAVDRIAFLTARLNGVDPESVPLIEEFKKLIR